MSDQEQKHMNSNYDVVVIGGGAAGFFGAISMAELNPNLSIAILESTNHFLRKVKISGGGRCNVTNRIEDPKELVKNYPRGGRNLLSAFFQFGSKEMKEWLESHQVEIKTEPDGRVFPQSNSSQTIIDLFYRLCHEHKIQLIKKAKVSKIKPAQESEQFEVDCETKSFQAKSVLMATGSAIPGHRLIERLGHRISPLSPSLFTLKTNHAVIDELAGISVQEAHAEIKGKVENKKIKFSQTGPILITHWGFSGPAIIKLSAFAAEYFKQCNYQGNLKVNWLPNQHMSEFSDELIKNKKSNPKKHLSKIISQLSDSLLPKRLILKFLALNEIQDTSIADISDKKLRSLIESIFNANYPFTGKGEFKEEFVTCGGVDLKEVDMKTFESKLVPNLYFAGEVLNIDGITGGFNFQNAWTGARLAAIAINKKRSKNDR